MALPKAHPTRLVDQELERLLALTARVLAQSQARLREADDGLFRANRDNNHQRTQLAEFRRAISRQR